MKPEIERALSVLKNQGDEIKFVFFAMDDQFFIAASDDCSVVKVVGQLEIAKSDLVAGVERHEEDVTTNKQVLNLVGGML
jgi:hypothetical protein